MDEIIVGIPTDGKPRIERKGELTVLHNMLIGKDFHWQKSIEAILPGSITLHPDEPFSVINRLPLEQYLECVIGSEMNPEAPLEFLKAHAVISRSWAAGKISGIHPHSDENKIFTAQKIVNWEDTCDHHGFHVCSDDHCQRYQGIQPLHGKLREALKATRGEILLSADGYPVDARFSKCCGGKTEVFSTCWQPREEPCLESFDDPWCDLSTIETGLRQRVLRSILKDYDLQNGGGYSWTAEVTAEEIRKNLLVKFGRDIGDITGIEIVSRGPSGRAVSLLVKGTEGELTIGKELMIRRLLDPTHLYSSWFEIRHLPEERKWKLTGRGWGHGVGLCQIGAARMALEGYDYREILSFYYPGSHLSLIITQ